MDKMKLIRMANQIAEFFDGWPDRDVAGGEVANHLRRYWTPAMRAQLAASVAECGDNAAPLVRAAVLRFARDVDGVAVAVESAR